MIGWFGSDILDAVGSAASDVGDALSSAVAAVPGLKDFAGTVVGKVVLTAISGGLYGAAVPVLGPQLAAITFALPGVVKGDSFAQAWTQGFVERVTALIKYFVSVGIPDDLATSQVGQVTQDAFDKLNSYASQFSIDGLDVHQLAKLAGVREDFAALFLAQATGNLSLYVDHLFDPATGRMLPDAPTTQDVLQQIQAHAAKVAQIAPAALTSTTAQGQEVQQVVQSYLRSAASVGVLARAPSSSPATSSTSVHAPAPAAAPVPTAAIAAAVALALGGLYFWYRS